MKKVLLSLAFVLATGSLVNASTSAEKQALLKLDEAEIDCIALAFEADKKKPLTYEQFVAVVEACEEAQG
jgi:hypothetical protein